MALLYPENNNNEHQELFGSLNPSTNSEFCNLKLMCIVFSKCSRRGKKGSGPWFSCLRYYLRPPPPPRHPFLDSNNGSRSLSVNGRENIVVVIYAKKVKFIENIFKKLPDYPTDLYMVTENL
jgi:hypothetical protein